MIRSEALTLASKIFTTAIGNIYSRVEDGLVKACMDYGTWSRLLFTPKANTKALQFGKFTPLTRSLLFHTGLLCRNQNGNNYADDYTVTIANGINVGSDYYGFNLQLTFDPVSSNPSSYPYTLYGYIYTYISGVSSYESLIWSSPCATSILSLLDNDLSVSFCIADDGDGNLYCVPRIRLNAIEYFTAQKWDITGYDTDYCADLYVNITTPSNDSTQYHFLPGVYIRGVD